MKLISSIVSGFLSAPFVIGWLAIMSIVSDAIYDKVLAPIAALYGYDWPDVPFWQWIVAGMIISYINFIFQPTRKNEFTNDEMTATISKRIGLAACFFALAYLINWIWL